MLKVLKISKNTDILIFQKYLSHQNVLLFLYLKLGSQYFILWMNLSRRPEPKNIYCTFLNGLGIKTKNLVIFNKMSILSYFSIFSRINALSLFSSKKYSSLFIEILTPLQRTRDTCYTWHLSSIERYERIEKNHAHQ